MTALIVYTTAMNYISQQQKQARKPPHELLISAGIWFAILCWGGAYVAARFLLHPVAPQQVALSPALLAALRFGIASFFFVLPLAHAIRQRQVSRSEEHTSELQSRPHLVCRLLLEKK